MKPLQHLKSLALEADRMKYPNTPERYRALPSFSDSSTNGLTKCITAFLKYSGWQVERIAVTGRLLDQRITVMDVCGKIKRVGSTKWIKSSMQAGTADLSAIVKGRSIKIEIKCAKTGDRHQSDAQKLYQKQAGGICLIVHDFEQFSKVQPIH
jgi:hypothetical protein